MNPPKPLDVAPEIRQARHSDISQVAAIEAQVEGEHAAAASTLMARLETYPEGFWVATVNGAVVGYIQSCKMRDTPFATFEEIRDFPQQHAADGKILYVIFLAVSPAFRRNGIGSSLVRHLTRQATVLGCEEVRLVAGEGFLPAFYEGSGFAPIRGLPDFLPHSGGLLMGHTSGNASSVAVIPRIRG